MENQGQIAAESRNMNRVATVREKSGKTENFLRSGKIFDIVKSQGILFSGLQFISFLSL